MNIRSQVALLSFVLLFGQIASVWHTVAHVQPPLHVHGFQPVLVFAGADHVHQHDVSHDHHFQGDRKANKSAHDDAEDDLCLIYHTATGQCAVLPAEPVLAGSPEALMCVSAVLPPVIASYNDQIYRIRAPPTFPDTPCFIG